MDEQQRGRLLDDLKGFLKGEILFDNLTCSLYSTDASIFQVRPTGVVFPRDEEDVQSLVRFASDNDIPLVPRGAGTGLAGESLGKGLAVDMSRHFRNIGRFSEEAIQVQPGVTCKSLNDHLAQFDRRFAPDPASAPQCTIGGMVATNASGSKRMRFGYTRDYVEKVRLVLDNGDAVTISKELLHSKNGLPNGGKHPPENGNGGPGHLQDIITATAVLLEQNSQLIQSSQPKTRYNRCGYLLRDLVSEGSLDLAKLVVGSEGTLGLITEVTLRTVSTAKGRSLVLLGFDRLDLALTTVSPILSTNPAACELIDRRLLSLARGSDFSHLTPLIPTDLEAVLLVEYETDSQEEAEWAARRLPYLLSRNRFAATLLVTALKEDQIQDMVRLREMAYPNHSGLRQGGQPLPIIDDIAVPTEHLEKYVHEVQEILQEHETTASLLIHAGTGQVHMRPFLDLNKPEEIARINTISEKVHSIALEKGGTISTQHGTGLARTPWVSRQYKDLYPIFRQIKSIFDPQGIFNPGKIVDPDPNLPRWPIRQIPPPQENYQPNLLWAEDQIRHEILRCNGCGQCRMESAPKRMCPVFHATHEEAASPRAKVNLLRQILMEEEGFPNLPSNEVREVADLCVNCKMCARECPSRVNIPKLMLEAKAANVSEHGLERKDWFFARLEAFSRWASPFALFVNLALANKTIRWLLEGTFGLSRYRRIPPFALRSFLQRARRRGWTRMPRGKNPKVAYFVDLFANFNDPSIAEAVVAVLHHNNIDVIIPSRQRGCGMAALVHGDIDSARDSARRNLIQFAELAREGIPILCSEPTAALMLRQEYVQLLNDADAHLVASQTIDLSTFLWQLYQDGKLKTDFQPLHLSLGHHVPCHVKALEGSICGPKLLELIPGLRVHTIDKSCSGIAGTYGMKAANFHNSLAAGHLMLQELKRPRILFGSTECSTCRMQMEDGAGKRTFHPVQYLALAYGLLPDLSSQLKEPLRELVSR